MLCPFCRNELKIHLNGIATLRSRCGHYSHIETVSETDGLILVHFRSKE